MMQSKSISMPRFVLYAIGAITSAILVFAAVRIFGQTESPKSESSRTKHEDERAEIAMQLAQKYLRNEKKLKPTDYLNEFRSVYLKVKNYPEIQKALRSRILFAPNPDNPKGVYQRGEELTYINGENFNDPDYPILEGCYFARKYRKVFMYLHEIETWWELSVETNQGHKTVIDLAKEGKIVLKGSDKDLRKVLKNPRHKSELPAYDLVMFTRPLSREALIKFHKKGELEDDLTPMITLKWKNKKYTSKVNGNFDFEKNKMERG